MVEFLLRRGARPELPGGPAWAAPAAWASRRGHQGIVALLEVYAGQGTLPRRGVEAYEALANDLAQAYGSGDREALRRLTAHFQPERALTWELLVRRTRERLGKPSEPAAGTDTLDPGDARLLIARWHGFRSWDELAEDGAFPPRSPRGDAGEVNGNGYGYGYRNVCGG